MKWLPVGLELPRWEVPWSWAEKKKTLQIDGNMYSNMDPSHQSPKSSLNKLVVSTHLEDMNYILKLNHFQTCRCSTLVISKLPSCVPESLASRHVHHKYPYKQLCLKKRSMACFILCSSFNEIHIPRNKNKTNKETSAQQKTTFPGFCITYQKFQV